MAYFNGTNIAFNVILNGSLLDPEMVQFAETMKKWATLDIMDVEITETYDLILPEWISETTFNACFLPNLHERVFKSETLSKIETNSMFGGCTKLEEVYLPSAKEISANCFADCSSLTDVTLGVITNVNTNSFRTCSAIKNFTIGEGATAPLLNTYQSPEITQESVKGIIDAYADMTSAGGAELHFADTVYNAIPEDVKQAARAKGLTFTQEK